MQNNLALKILIVDDDETIRTLLIEFFTSVGHFADTAIDGEEGFKKVISNNYDLILMDINMPNMNGIDCIKAIRLVDATIPILIISGDDAKHYLAQSSESETIKFLKKPFDLSELDTAIKKIFIHE